MFIDPLIWTAKRWGWHVADSKATPGAVYHIMPCADGYSLHKKIGDDCYVLLDLPQCFANAVDAKQAAQAWESNLAKQASELQHAATGSVGP